MSSIWGFTVKYKINQLQVIQNGALKNLLKLPYDTRTLDIYEKTNILPNSIIPKYKITLLIKNMLEGDSIINSTF
jgi:hypothetical protein